MSVRLASTEMTLKLCTAALTLSLLAGCTSMYEEHQRASAIQQEKYMQRALNEYQTAGTRNAELWQMPSEQAVNFEKQLTEIADSYSDDYLTLGNAQSLNCDLDAETRSWVVYQMSVAKRQRVLADQASLGNRNESIPQVSVIKGQCDQGKIEGDFVAVYSYDYSFSGSNMSTRTQIKGRSEGTMQNGVPSGELLATSKDTSVWGLSGTPTTTHHFKISDYDKGVRTGSSVTLSRTSSGDVLTVAQVISERRGLGLSWMLGKPNTRYFFLDGELDGYMQFANATLSDSPSCYRQGKKLSSTAYCEGIKNELEALVDESLAK